MITPVCVCPPRMSKNGGALLHKLQPCVVCLPVVTNANSPESAFCMYIIRVPLWFGSVLEVKGKHDVSAWFLHVFLVSQLGLLLYTFHIGIEHSLTLRVLFCWSVLFFILFAWIFCVWRQFIQLGGISLYSASVKDHLLLHSPKTPGDILSGRLPRCPTSNITGCQPCLYHNTSFYILLRSLFPGIVREGMCLVNMLRAH